MYGHLRLLNRDLTWSERFENPWPSEVEQVCREIVQGYFNQYQERPVDFFVCNVMGNRGLQGCLRGTEKHLEVFSDHQWFDHLTGKRTPTFDRDGFHFHTYRDDIRRDVFDALYAYCFDEGDGNRDEMSVYFNDDVNAQVAVMLYELAGC